MKYHVEPLMQYPMKLGLPWGIADLDKEPFISGYALIRDGNGRVFESADKDFLEHLAESLNHAVERLEAKKEMEIIKPEEESDSTKKESDR